MITKTQAFQISDGNTYQTLELAQRAELFQLLAGHGRTDEESQKICTLIHEKREQLCEILRASGRKPRKAKAGRNGKRKASTPPLTA